MPKKQKSWSIFLRKFKSIRMAMLVSFSTLIIVTLISFLFISLNYTEDTVLNNSTEYTSKIIKQVNVDIDAYITYMENISSLVAYNNDVQNYLFDTDLNSTTETVLYQSILTQFSTVMEGREDICNIGILADSGKHVLNAGKSELNEYASLDTMKWYKNTITNMGTTSLSSSHVQNLIKYNYQWVVTLSRSIRNPYINGEYGIFFVDLNYSAISDLCENNSLGTKGFVFILDADGNIVYHPQQQLLYSGLKTERINEVMNCTENSFVTEEGDNSKLYTIATSEKTGWKVVGVAYVSELQSNKDETQLIYIVVTGMLLLTTILMSIILSSAITRPIKGLQESMKEVEQGNFEVVDTSSVLNNEIGSLYHSFNVMTIQIQRLMEQNIIEQRQKRKSELRALQSQINPHFLYNTLDSIVWMSEGKKYDEVVLMTSSLAKLFRQNISNEEEFVAIKNEVEYTENYLIIQQMRYKDKLEYHIDVDKDIYMNNIVKLVLQPLVENAIYHGIKYKEGRGLIEVTGYAEENEIILSVHDDGQGMDDETLMHIFDKHSVNYKSNGVGVYNVQQRLQLHYGKEYGIRYDSKLGEGTTAMIIIPKEIKTGEVFL